MCSFFFKLIFPNVSHYLIDPLISCHNTQQIKKLTPHANSGYSIVIMNTCLLFVDVLSISCYFKSLLLLLFCVLCLHLIWNLNFLCVILMIFLIWSWFCGIFFVQDDNCIHNCGICYCLQFEGWLYYWKFIKYLLCIFHYIGIWQKNCNFLGRYVKCGWKCEATVRMSIN